MSVHAKPHLHRAWIDPFAIMIVERLQRKGFTTYLVGGCVRDLLAGQRPKDFDIVTNASPEQIKQTVDRAFIIGRRFRLVLVKRGQDQFEVATFRKDPPPEDSLSEEGLQISDNAFGTPEEDARRRDFTVNSMFYDPVKDEVIDFCEGMKDIDARMIRIIGDPKTRLTEDPIRILRALRLAHKLDFTIESSLREAMLEKAPTLTLTALPRRREEMLKILRLDDPTSTLHESHDLGILKHAFPTLDQMYNDKAGIDDFDSYLCRIHAVETEKAAEPLRLFGVLILAYFRALIHQNAHVKADTNARNQSDLIDFMKKELGIFNLEASLILSAIDMQHELVEIEEFKKRGHRRKRGFLRNEAFPLALHFAEIDHVLSPTDLAYWKKEFETVADEIGEDEPRERRPRRRRRRGSSSKPSDDSTQS